MTKANVIVVFIFAAGILGFSLLQLVETTEKDAGVIAAPRGSTSSKHDAEVEQEQELLRETSIAPEENRPERDRLLSKSEAIAAQLRPLSQEKSIKDLVDPIEVGRSYADFVARATSGDSSAALSLYTYSKFCMSVAQMQGDHQTYPSCEAYRAHPQYDAMHWLSLANNARDPRAAIYLYGLVSDAININQNSNMASMEMRMAAISALENALGSGVEEVFRILSAVYLDGRLTPQNHLKAFLYIDIYARASGDEAAIQRASQLKLGIRQGDWSEIENTLQGILERVRKPMHK